MRTSNPIASLFGKSPFGAMQEHMRAVLACASQVPELFRAVRHNDAAAIDTAKALIFEHEHEADRVKNEIRSELPRSFFMPVDRRDLLDMLDAQDSIADTAQDVAGLVVMRSMRIPDGLEDDVEAFVECNVRAAAKCGQIIDEFDELLETSFRGRQAELVQGLIAELGVIETEADDRGMALLTTLFEREDELKPLDVVFWNQLVHMIGDISDHAEDVGDRLRLLIAS